MIHLKRLLLLTILTALAACSSARVLAPTPNIFADGAYPQSEISPAYQTAQSEIFFITDRNATRHDGLLSYGHERSSSMAFGASTVAFGENQDWQSLSTASGLVKRDEEIKLSIIQNREILRFDKTRRRLIS
jgi:esterase/lipase superfamily enzyme